MADALQETAPDALAEAAWVVKYNAMIPLVADLDGERSEEIHRRRGLSQGASSSPLGFSGPHDRALRRIVKKSSELGAGLLLHDHRLVATSWADDDWYLARTTAAASDMLRIAQAELKHEGLQYETAKKGKLMVYRNKASWELELAAAGVSNPDSE